MKLSRVLVHCVEAISRSSELLLIWIKSSYVFFSNLIIIVSWYSCINVIKVILTEPAAMCSVCVQADLCFRRLCRFIFFLKHRLLVDGASCPRMDCQSEE